MSYFFLCFLSNTLKLLDILGSKNPLYVCEYVYLGKYKELTIY